MKMVPIYSSARFLIRGPGSGTNRPQFTVPEGRSVVPEAVLKWDELQENVAGGAIQLNSKFGDQPSEARRKRVKEHTEKHRQRVEQNLPGPALAQARPVTNAKGEEVGRWEVVSLKTHERLRSFDTEEEAQVFAEARSAEAWRDFLEGAA